MSKTSNTVFLMIGATLFNIIIMLVLVVLFFTLPGLLLPQAAYEKAMPYLFPVLFVVPIVITFLLYTWAMKIFQRKVDMEKHFNPIFRRRGPKQQQPRD